MSLARQIFCPKLNPAAIARHTYLQHSHRYSGYASRSSSVSRQQVSVVAPRTLIISPGGAYAERDRLQPRPPGATANAPRQIGENKIRAILPDPSSVDADLYRSPSPGSVSTERRRVSEMDFPQFGAPTSTTARPRSYTPRFAKVYRDRQGYARRTVTFRASSAKCKCQLAEPD